MQRIAHKKSPSKASERVFPDKRKTGGINPPGFHYMMDSLTIASRQAILAGLSNSGTGMKTLPFMR
jgi:hypothetical protein